MSKPDCLKSALCSILAVKCNFSRCRSPVIVMRMSDLLVEVACTTISERALLAGLSRGLKMRTECACPTSDPTFVVAWQ
eukprot:4415140-Amphidinium_carterae.1